MLIISSILLGLVCIALEFYLPGGILAVIGSLALIVGVVLFAEEATPREIILLISGIILSLVILIRLILWKIVHTQKAYSIYSDLDQKGFQASDYDKAAIGKIGVVLADLKPGGFIMINGVQYTAISISGYISKGKEVLVLSGQEQSLIVKLYKKDEHL